MFSPPGRSGNHVRTLLSDVLILRMNRSLGLRRTAGPGGPAGPSLPFSPPPPCKKRPKRFRQKSNYWSYLKYQPDNQRRVYFCLGHTHRGSRKSSLTGEASQSWGPIFSGASWGSRVSLGSLLSWGTRKSLLSRWTRGSGMASLAHGAGLSWWTLGGRRNRWRGREREETRMLAEERGNKGNW